MYKVEKSKKGIKLFVLAEAENENGEKVMVRKLIREQSVKKMLKGLDGEKGMYESDIKTAEGGLAQIEEIKMLISELNADSKA